MDSFLLNMNNQLNQLNTDKNIANIELETFSSTIETESPCKILDDQEKIKSNVNFVENFEIKAKILSPSEENIKICADLIKKGGIVGMPTETVYGLGASYENIEAVNNIFKYKGRPLSDPLIVHVSSLEMAKNLIDKNVDLNIIKIMEKLTEKYWPGPLTLVLQANFDKISKILTANTNFIGIRFPNNEIARKLIEYSGVPIAAPSANKFCHVSPTKPSHVFEDFKEFPVSILDGGECNFSMESTVVKIEISDNKIKLIILRMGAISPQDLYETLESFENLDMPFILSYKDKNYQKKDFAKDQLNIEEIIIKNEYKKKDELATLESELLIDQEAPGQFIKHYSPSLETFIFEDFHYTSSNSQNENNILYLKKSEILKKIVLIDYKNILKEKFEEKKINVENILSLGDDSEAVMKKIYDLLRKAEKIEGAEKILLIDINRYLENTPHKETINDRFLKASSSNYICLSLME